MSINSQEQMETSPSSVPTSNSSARGRRPRQRARGNNSTARRNEQFRERTGQKVLADYRASQNLKFYGTTTPDFSLPSGFSLKTPSTSLLQLPVSTLGVGAAVSELYCRFPDIHKFISIYQLYRITLAQFEFQLFIAYEARNVSSRFPYTGLTFAFDEDFRTVLRAHPDNFKCLIMLIETVGYFKHGDTECITYIPEGVSSLKPFVRFTNLKHEVNQLSLTQSDWSRNALPGAIVISHGAEEGRLANPQDFWPNGYSSNDLRTDCGALIQALEHMKTKYEQVVASCSYSGQGKSAALVCAVDPDIVVPYTKQFIVEGPSAVPSATPDQPDSSPKKRPAVPSDEAVDDDSSVIPFKIRRICTKGTMWYSREHLSDLDFTLGSYSLVGSTWRDWEAHHAELRVRNEYITTRRVSDYWTALFDQCTPRVARR